MGGHVPGRLLAALLAALVLPAGCSEGAPSDASAEGFCQEWTRLPSAQTGREFRDVARTLERVGTPADISDDQRDGFEVFVRVANSLDADATLDELVDPTVSDSEARNLRVFIEYSSETCRSLDEGSGTL